MIINLRGTGGSGKSTIVRQVMSSYASKIPTFITGRRQPISYLLQNEHHPPLVVLGHYETPCGGTDTITKPDDVFRMVRDHNTMHHDVLFEGIIVGDDVTRTATLHLDGLPLMVIALNTPLEECFRGIQARRDERGDDRPFDKKNTTSRAERLKRNMSRLKASGVETHWCSRGEAFDLIQMTLGRISGEYSGVQTP